MTSSSACSPATPTRCASTSAAVFPDVAVPVALRGRAERLPCCAWRHAANFSSSREGATVAPWVPSSARGADDRFVAPRVSPGRINLCDLAHDQAGGTLRSARRTISRRGPSMSVAHETLPLSIGELQRTREPLERATALPQAAFTDPRVLDWEVEHVFMGGWICVGHVDQVRERGDYLMVELGRESVFVVADDDGLPRAFLNTCRHRGARLVQEPEGRLRAPAVPVPRLVLRLRRLAAQRAATPTSSEDFDPQCFALHAVRAGRRRGPRPARPVAATRRRRDEHVGDLAPALAALPPRRTCSARARIVYDVDANWKAIAENYSECLHCPGVHPELNRLCHYLSRRDDRGRRRVVRRLDDAAPRARPRWPRRRPRAPGDRRVDRARPALGRLLPDLPRTRWSRCTPTT